MHKVGARDDSFCPTKQLNSATVLATAEMLLVDTRAHVSEPAATAEAVRIATAVVLRGRVPTQA